MGIAKAKKAEAEAEKDGKFAKYVTTHIKESRCENNAGCSALNLKGFCCPNLDGTRLGCCGTQTALLEDDEENTMPANSFGTAVFAVALFAGLVVMGVIRMRQRATFMTE